MPMAKKEKTVVITIRLPAKDAVALAKKAKEDGRTRSSLCCRTFERESDQMKRNILAIAVAGSLAFAGVTSPAAAWYRHGYRPYYRSYDPGPGPAIAGAFMGIAFGAVASPYGGYGYAPFAYPTRVYYPYPNSSYNPYSFGPAGCAAGFYWNGAECWPY